MIQTLRTRTFRTHALLQFRRRVNHSSAIKEVMLDNGLVIAADDCLSWLVFSPGSGLELSPYEPVILVATITIQRPANRQHPRLRTGFHSLRGHYAGRRFGVDVAATAQARQQNSQHYQTTRTPCHTKSPHSNQLDKSHVRSFGLLSMCCGIPMWLFASTYRHWLADWRHKKKAETDWPPLFS